jgi:hypothetical protein
MTGTTELGVGFVFLAFGVVPLGYWLILRARAFHSRALADAQAALGVQRFLPFWVVPFYAAAAFSIAVAEGLSWTLALAPAAAFAVLGAIKVILVVRIVGRRLPLVGGV